MTLTDSNLRYLLAIHHLAQQNTEVSPLALAQVMGVTKPSVTSILTSLMKQGAVVRRRYGKIYITDRGEWLRVQGTANFDNTPEAQAAAFQVMPQLADLYNEETGNKLGIVYLDHLSAKLFSMSGTVKDIMSY